MLFNSFEFIFVFLPFVFVGYFLLNKIHMGAALLLLLLCSLVFYSWWNPIYLPLMLASLGANYFFGIMITKIKPDKKKKVVLSIGLLFNVSLLGFFKYTDFFIKNANIVLQEDFNLLHLVLPLAISFYTFQQIAYLVDSYRGETKEYNFVNYALFISFFPQLIAGPIVHHSEVINQYQDKIKKKINWENISKGLFIFSIGLFKKVGIADTFAIWANNGFSSSESLTFFDSWITSLSYTFQLYFDFSGYTDMAIGAALLFNITLPINFYSPYKAVSIQDFWRRWHITLSKFLLNYIYIPLGGNKKGPRRTYINILIIFFVSGFWHGAGWTFVVWGLLHGGASVIHRGWSKAGFKLPKLVAWFITFQFINATWVLFRAPNFGTAVDVLSAMIGLNKIQVPNQILLIFNWNIPEAYLYTFNLTNDLSKTVIYLIIALFVSLFLKNSIQLTKNLGPNPVYSIYAAILFVYAAFRLQNVSEFLYFNF
ncbi:MBOAT family protein [Virgibacillus necropolis]|uniref:MBOAT family O-acyltransferase n=1 Tax=Virgibacillus necropolis TaxID=163877 RepID=UPI00384BB400